MTATAPDAEHTGRPDRRPRRRGPRRQPDRHGPSTSSTTSTWCCGPARSSAWSASPAPARPRSAPRCSATPGPARSSRRGKVLLEDRDVLKLPWKEVRQLRGEEIAYVPQDPASALNPSIRIGKQIVELHRAARHRHRRVAAAGRARRPGRGRAAQRRRVPQALRPPALGRPGAARRAGDGVPAQAQGARARRADHRSRRHHPEDGARHDGASCAAPTASARSTSPTTSRWSPTSPTGSR